MVCTKCLVDKSEDHFPSKSRRCRDCRNAYMRDWNAKHKEQVSASHKKTIKKHYTAYVMRHKRWRDQNRDICNGYKQAWKALDPEHAKFIACENSQRRRQIMKTGKVTQQEWQDQLATFNNHCAYCLKPLDKAEMEHMKPLSRGGEHSIDNIVPSCPSCNRLKSTKTLLEFARTSCAA